MNLCNSLLEEGWRRFSKNRMYQQGSDNSIESWRSKCNVKQLGPPRFLVAGISLFAANIDDTSRKEIN